MSPTPPPSAPSMPGDGARAPFLARLRTVGILPTDDEETCLSKSLLVFATGLMSATSGAWLLLYWILGPKLPSTLPFLFQVLLAGNFAFYIHSGRFDWFRMSQLGLFLFFPFVAQWSLGNFITASGVILWGLLAPIGAVLCLGGRASVPWFFAYVFLTALTGFFDYYLADFTPSGANGISTRTSMVFFVLNFVSVSGIVYALIRHAISERHRARERLEEAHRLLRVEQARSERLLLNVLPGAVAERLKTSDQTIADGFSDVTVMFADIVNFTRIASHMSANEVFAMLNEIFSTFDELAEALGLEKIKTIGDAYMVAGGLDGRIAAPCEAVATLALEMRDALRRRGRAGGPRLELRAGIATGPVVAGVVGKKKFIYDLWGDTVNLASRLSEEGHPSAIQCDRRTFERLRERFRFDTPLHLQVKGKGSIEVHRLLQHRPSAPLPITSSEAAAGPVSPRP